jgi:signal transduction histidine kinase
VSVEQPILLSALPPSRRQVRLAQAIAALLLASFVATLPFRHLQFSEVGTFIPVVDAILAFSDLIAAATFFAQYLVLGSRALLALGSGFLFTGLLIILHALAFPGAFAPEGLLGAGVQTAALIYIVWHFGLPCSAIVYALIKNGAADSQNATGTAVLTAITATFLAIAAVWAVAVSDSHFLPLFQEDLVHAAASWSYMAPAIVLFEATALGVVWWKRQSVLDLWLLVVLWAWLIESLMLSTTMYRYSFPWYAGRICALVAATFVLFALVSQTMALYARLARAMAAQNRERESRFLSIDAALGSVAHEVNQPIFAIRTNATSALHNLKCDATDRAELEAILNDIISDSGRAAGAIDAIRALFRRDNRTREPVDVENLLRASLSLVKTELRLHGVSVSIAIDPDLPAVSGNWSQLQQVLLNLIANAIDAMDSIESRPRTLRVSAAIEGRDVLVTIQDSGPGIDPAMSERVEEPFFTTKPNGTGLGLAICRSIVEGHSGRMRVAAATPHGTAVEFALPTAAAEAPA